CSGVSCTNFAQVGTSVNASFSNTGLTASTSYGYRVRATDAAGNLSNYSNTASATTSAQQQSETPAFIQVASAVPQSGSVTTVQVTYATAQTAGNLNVVIVGCNDTAALVTAVTDTAGNVYNLALGPTFGAGLSQSIYYAKNIAAAAPGVNKVTVTFSPGAAFPDIRILEYSGIDSSTPIDVFAGASGNSASSATSAVATTNPTDLLVAGNMVVSHVTGAGTGFTSRVITSPDGDIAEDRVVTATGSYSATAPLSPAGAWVMQMVAFRAAGSPPPPPDTIPPTVSITTPTQGAMVTGVVSLAATASDNRGVAGVQFKVDGANVGAEDTTTPYAMAWDTTGFATGNHVVTAVARDAAGNSTTSSPVTVN